MRLKLTMIDGILVYELSNSKGVVMRWMLIIVGFFVFASCNATKAEEEPKKMGLANPASVKCHDDGYRLEIRKDAAGNENGICIDGAGKECDEWAYFRGECTLGKPVRHR